MIENTLDALAGALGLYIITLMVPRYLCANGTRPFVAGYLLMSVLMVVGAIRGLTVVDEGVFYPAIRATFGAVLIGTTIWATAHRSTE